MVPKSIGLKMTSWYMCSDLGTGEQNKEALLPSMTCDNTLFIVSDLCKRDRNAVILTTHSHMSLV